MPYKRIIELDIIKGILIIFVILGHSYISFSRSIFWFHMPAFFIVSGYAYNLPPEIEIVKWIRKNVRRLMIPYLTYAALLSAIAAFEMGGG